MCVRVCEFVKCVSVWLVGGGMRAQGDDRLRREESEFVSWWLVGLSTWRLRLRPSDERITLQGSQGRIYHLSVPTIGTEG